MITIENTQRIAKILRDGKHVKSFPLSVSHCLIGLTGKICDEFKKGLRLQEKDIELTKHLIFPIMLQDFYETLKEKEPYVFERIVDIEVVGCREVVSRENNRFELCFSNGAKVKINDLLFKFAIEKLPTAYLNY